MRDRTVKRYSTLYGKFNDLQIMSFTVCSTLFFNCCERLCDLPDSAENRPTFRLFFVFFWSRNNVDHATWTSGRLLKLVLCWFEFVLESSRF